MFFQRRDRNRIAASPERTQVARERMRVRGSGVRPTRHLFLAGLLAGASVAACAGLVRSAAMVGADPTIEAGAQAFADSGADPSDTVYDATGPTPYDASVEDGNSPEGGSPVEDGDSPEDGGPADACVPVTFGLRSESMDASYFYTYLLPDDSGDRPLWLSVFAADGSPLSIFQEYASSNACGPPPVNSGRWDCQPLPNTGVNARWDGTRVITTASSCTPDGGGQPIPCEIVECVPPGRYVVKICAQPRSYYCPYSDADVCVHVRSTIPRRRKSSGHCHDLTRVASHRRSRPTAQPIAPGLVRQSPSEAPSLTRPPAATSAPGNGRLFA
jgi:hypothetical protein